jgi:hypothetical protein
MSKAKPPGESATPPAHAKQAQAKQIGVAKPRKGEAAFDLWLQKGLHDIYDSVAREPVPDELLKLIEEDRKR